MTNDSLDTSPNDPIFTPLRSSVAVVPHVSARLRYGLKIRQAMRAATQQIWHITPCKKNRSKPSQTFPPKSQGELSFNEKNAMFQKKKRHIYVLASSFQVNLYGKCRYIFLEHLGYMNIGWTSSAPEAVKRMATMDQAMVKAWQQNASRIEALKIKSSHETSQPTGTFRGLGPGGWWFGFRLDPRKWKGLGCLLGGSSQLVSS